MSGDPGQVRTKATSVHMMSDRAERYGYPKGHLAMGPARFKREPSLCRPIHVGSDYKTETRGHDE